MDNLTKKTRSRVMACVRSSGNKSTEMAFIAIMKANSIKGWRRNYSLYGKPDFVFPVCRVAVFIDGCFWHKCPKHCRVPSSNIEYWTKKIHDNAIRDRHVTKHLRKKGWNVIRFWEHDFKGGRSFSQKISRLKKIIE